MAAPLCLPISNSWESSSCSASSILTSTWFSQFYKFSHSNRCVMVSHCGFNFHFPNDKYFEHFLCLFTIHMFSLINFKSLNSCLFSYYWVVCFLMIEFWEFFTNSRYRFLSRNALQVFSSCLWLVLYFFKQCLLNIDEVQFIDFLLWIILFVFLVRNHCGSQSHRRYVLFFFLGV